jgi:hypothetical protein
LAQSKSLKINIIVILSVVVYGCETWDHTLRQEHRLRVFESRVLRKVFEPKRGKVGRVWIKLFDEELHNVYS